jgi:hypothetical protein
VKNFPNQFPTINLKNPLSQDQNQNNIFCPRFDWNFGIGYQLFHLKESFSQLNNGIDSIDFAEMRFMPPLLAVHYASFILESKTVTNISGINRYLETIRFPVCLSSENDLDWGRTLGNYSLKTYLPIIKFSTSSSDEGSFAREAVLSHVARSIRTIVNLPTNYFSVINYLISELTDNIIEHSANNYGYLSFQYYRENQFMDICLADKGIGIYGSYQNYVGSRDFSNITDHLTAVDSAIKGQSTKLLPEQRGFGMATSRRILTEGLGGKFVYLTGNALLINEELSNFGTDFKGSIVLIRIPVGNFNTKLSWVDFVE